MATGEDRLLTDEEERVLRAVTPGFTIKKIAIQLDKSPETVKSQLRACRVKYGVSSSLDAANLFAAHERKLLVSGVNPARVIAENAVTGESADATWGPGPPTIPDVVHEVPATTFLHSDARQEDAPTRGILHGLSPLERLTLIAVMVAVLIFALIAAPALHDSSQRVANSIDPPKH